MTAAIPAFNAERFIADAVTSVLQQSYQPIECVVIDDGSTDATREVVRTFGDVRYVRQQNKGDAAARNRAAAEATGEYIAFLDSDDVWLPEKIEVQMQHFATDPDLGMVYAGVQVVDETLRPLHVLSPAPSGDALRNTLLVEKPYMTGVGSTSIVPAGIFSRVGGFDERLSASSDWAFACKLAASHRVAAVPGFLALYRQHGDGQVHRNLAAVEADTRLIFDEMFQHGVIDERLLRLRRRAEANVYLSLAARYFIQKELGQFARCIARALMRRPDRVLAAIWRRYMVAP